MMKFKTFVLCLKLLTCVIVQRSFGKKRTYGLKSVNLVEMIIYIFFILAYQGIKEVCKNSNQLVVKESLESFEL